MRLSNKAVLIALTLLLLTCGLNRIAEAQSKPLQSNNQEVKGKALVTNLPGSIKGVVLENGRIKLKPGFKFVRKSNNTFVVMRMAGGGGKGITGSFSCSCTKSGSCSAIIDAVGVICASKGCSGNCRMVTTVDGVRKSIIAF